MFKISAKNSAGNTGMFSHPMFPVEFHLQIKNLDGALGCKYCMADRCVLLVVTFVTYQTHRCFLWQRSKAGERFPVHQGARKFGAVGMSSTALVLPRKISAQTSCRVSCPEMLVS